MFPSFHPLSLSFSPIIFFSSLSRFSPLVWCRSVCYRKETVLLLFPSSLGGVVPLLLPLPSALSPFERHRATQPCSPREHAECRSAPIRFPHAGQCMCACARERGFNRYCRLFYFIFFLRTTTLPGCLACQPDERKTE